MDIKRHTTLDRRFGMVAGHSDLLNLLSMGTTVNGLWLCFQMNPHSRQEKENEVLSARRNPAQLGSLKPRLVTQHTGWLGTERCESWEQSLDLQTFWGMLHLQKLTMALGVKYFSH